MTVCSREPDAVKRSVAARSLRVLHVLPLSEIAGSERVILNLVRYRQDPAITHHAVLLADEDGATGAALSDLGVPWQRVPRGRMRSLPDVWRAVRALRRVMAASRPDVILANQAGAFLYARLATLGLRIPVALYFMQVPHGRLWRNEPAYVLMRLAEPDLVFAASQRIERVLRGWGLRRVRTVYHGTPPAAAPRETGALRAAHGIPPDAPLVLMPGRLHRWKGQHVLVEALPEVLRAHPAAHAVLLGGTLFGLDQEYAAELARRIGVLGLAGRVHLVGHGPVPPWLHEADVVVHASTEPDAFPNVCIEALAALRPLVTTECSGTAEVFRDGVHCSIVPPGRPDRLAAAIVRLLSDPALAGRMAAAGFERYRETCTPCHMAAPIEEELLCLAAGGSGLDAPPCGGDL